MPSETAAGGRRRPTTSREEARGAKTAAAREQAILALLAERTIGLAAARAARPPLNRTYQQLEMS